MGDVTNKLLIIYKENHQQVVNGVSNYGVNHESGMFWFDKNRYRSFLPKENVVFFGRKVDYMNEV